MKKYKILYILLILPVLFNLTSCSKLQKYHNKVTYEEYSTQLNDSLANSVLKDIELDDYFFNHETKLKYRNNKKEINTSNILEYDAELKAVLYTSKSLEEDYKYYGYVPNYISSTTLRIFDITNEDDIKEVEDYYSLENYLEVNSLSYFRISVENINDDFYIDKYGNKVVYTQIFSLSEFQINITQIVFDNNYISKFETIESTQENSTYEYYSIFNEIRIKSINLEKYYNMIQTVIMN